MLGFGLVVGNNYLYPSDFQCNPKEHDGIIEKCTGIRPVGEPWIESRAFSLAVVELVGHPGHSRYDHQVVVAYKFSQLTEQRFVLIWLGRDGLMPHPVSGTCSVLASVLIASKARPVVPLNLREHSNNFARMVNGGSKANFRHSGINLIGLLHPPSPFKWRKAKRLAGVAGHVHGHLVTTSIVGSTHPLGHRFHSCEVKGILNLIGIT